MGPIAEIKERQTTDTPLILFRCEFADGGVERWSTHRVNAGGEEFAARVLSHNAFEVRMGAEDGLDGFSRISLTLANADAYFSAMTRAGRWKGARLTVSFAFADAVAGEASSEEIVLFRGLVSMPDEAGERGVRISASNRLGAQRLAMPEVRIQKLCPWTFPRTAAERAEAVDGGAAGQYSLFYRCGYSPDIAGGTGSLDGATPFTSCDYSRSSCEARGMFSKDASNRDARRFGGIEFMPPAISVRGAGEASSRLSVLHNNEAKYNDVVPVVYGTAWVEPPVVLARNDGNLTRMEVLLGLGEMQGVRKLLVNDVEIPIGAPDASMTATGWYNVVAEGTRTGGFNLDFTDGTGNPIGDPYGSMAYVSVVVPNNLSDGRTLPRVKVLCDGLKLATYGVDGSYLGHTFTNNPAWVMLDVLLRSGWSAGELDLASFGQSAAHCSETVTAADLFGQPVSVARYECNIAIRRRTSVGELMRGVRQASGLYLRYTANGKLACGVEAPMTVQQPVKPEGSNATEALGGGWPAYEFGDGTLGRGGITRRANGDPTLRVYFRGHADSPNRYLLEFQDSFNEYQPDSLSLADVDDLKTGGQEVSAQLGALGIANFHQAMRMARRHLDRSVRGNFYVEFETSVKGVLLRPGDLITVTSLRDGLDRQAFRVLSLAPGMNHGRARISAQIHDDVWYSDSVSGANGERGSRRQPGLGVGVPRPLVGSVWGAAGSPELGITERAIEQGDGTTRISLSAEFVPPAKPALSQAHIPILALTPAISTSGGTLAGGQTYYYGVSAADAAGAESDLSYLVRATLPSGTSTNRVTLTGLGFSAGTSSFHVYRGKNPAQLLRIATGVGLGTSFEDAGAVAQLLGPPDENFDHARVDWRMELHPPVGATSFGAKTIGASTLQLTPNEFRGQAVRITSGRGAGQERLIETHTATALQTVSAWAIVPDATSEFAIVESAWQSGAAGAASPVEIEIPNREGATVHVMGRAVNALGVESSAELAPVARWLIGGAGSIGGDADVPPAPVFGLGSGGRGLIEMNGIGFSGLENTRTISAGTLMVHYWDELLGASSVSLAAPLDGVTTAISLSPATGAAVGQILQVGPELMEVIEVLSGGASYTVRRASHGSTAVAHGNGAAVYHLARRVFVIAFPRQFFGSPASGSFSYSAALASARVCGVELFMTNARGNGETAKVSYAALSDGGVRTLAGGQLNLQVQGHLAIQTNAAPPVVVERARSVRDVFAVVQQAPVGDPVTVRIRRDGVEYCQLTIPAGSNVSNTIPGASLAPLPALSRLYLDIVSVGQNALSAPGSDLTVTIRL